MCGRYAEKLPAVMLRSDVELGHDLYLSEAVWCGVADCKFSCRAPEVQLRSTMHVSITPGYEVSRHGSLHLAGVAGD